MPHRLIRLLLATLTATAILAPASTAAGAQNRVVAFSLAAQTHTGADAAQSPWTRPGSAAGSVRVAAGCCVAAKGATTGLTDGARVGIVREAFQRKGNFGLGSATRSEADDLGRDFVGPGYTQSRSKPDILISADGLRKYRPPSYKPDRGGYQSNLERRFEPGGPFNSNGHLEIVDP